MSADVKEVVVPESEFEEGLVLAGQLSPAALKHDTAKHARAEVERPSQEEAAARAAEAATHSATSDKPTPQPGAGEAAMQGASRPEDDSALKEPLMGSHQHRQHEQHQQTTHGSPGMLRSLVERVEKAVGILPHDHDAHHDRAPAGTTPEAGSAAAAHTALHVTPPASGLPPHDPAQAARERQQDRRQQAAAAAAEGSLLARELPSLVSIRDSARTYVDTLRHSVRQPDEAAAELAGGEGGARHSAGGMYGTHSGELAPPPPPPGSPPAGMRAARDPYSGAPLAAVPAMPHPLRSIFGGGGGSGSSSGSGEAAGEGRPHEE